MPPSISNKRLSLTFFTHYTELYGANLSLLNLIDGLGKYGIRAHVICPDQGDLLRVLTKRGIPTEQFPFEWWVSTQRTLTGAARRIYKNVCLLDSIAIQIARWQTDLVYSNSFVFAVGAMVAARLGLPHLWHLREFGNRDYNLWPDLGAWLTRRVLRTANARIFVSRALKQAFLGNAKTRNTYVIYNGVASEAEFDERRQAAETQTGRHQPFTFVLVGRFRKSKGHAIAIEAFAKVACRFPDVRLILVGDAGQTGEQDYYDDCRRRVKQLAISERTEFWGYIPDPERAFLAADVALMCSQNEAMGRVTVEAMSTCRPVIGNDCGGTSELIDPNRTGLLYRETSEDLAVCMTRYIVSPQLARQHGEEGWRVSRQRHSTETYAAQVYNVISEICK